MQFVNFNKSVLFFTLVILVFISSCEKDENIENPDYTIGTIYEYVPGWADGPTSVRFEYYINDKKLNKGYNNGENGWQIPGNAGYKSGDMFMVEYDLNKTDLARMLFDYPVKDSTDYYRYYKELKSKH
jgi:hypothetical protein